MLNKTSVHLGCFIALSISCQAALATPFITSEQAAQAAAKQQQEREQHERAQLKQQHDVRLQNPSNLEQTSIPENESPCFVVNNLQLEDDAGLLRHHDIEQIFTPFQQRCLGIQAISLLARRLQNHLIGQGWITSRIDIPPQDLSSGSLNLTVIAGRLEPLQSSNLSLRQLNLAFPSEPAQPLNLQDLEQGLENLKRLPSVDAQISIEPGQSPNSSQLLINYQQQKPWRLGLSLDDAGSRSTGQYQGGMNLAYDNLLGLNDLLYFSLTQDVGGREDGKRGSDAASLHYSLPWQNWLFSFNANHSQYQQSVQGAYQQYLYHGRTAKAELEARYRLQRNATSKTFLTLGTFAKRSRNFIDDTEVRVQRRQTGGWTLGLEHRHYLGQLTLDAQLDYTRGTGAYSALPAPEQAFGEGTARMAIINAKLAWQYPFTFANRPLQYHGQLHSQWNATPLSPSDRLQLGGRYSVRGFDGKQSLVGERGWYWRNDLLTPLGDNHQLYLGLDYGHVGGASTNWMEKQHLLGLAAGVKGHWQRLSYDLFVGKPLSKTPHLQTASTTAGFSLNWQY